MPPRIPLVAALRQPSAFFRGQKAQLSVSLPAQGLRNDVPSPSPSTPKPTSITSAILGVERSSTNSSSNSRSSPIDPTNAVSGFFDKLTARAPRGPAGSRTGVGGGVGSGTGTGTGTDAQRQINADLRTNRDRDDYARQMTRRWRPGDVYAPHDLSPSEMGKWRRNRARQQDLVDMLGLRPLDMYRNFSVISEFMTPHGRIKRAAETGLRPVNQRKMAKAIRRAIGLGLHPSVHHHPEILSREPVRRASQNQPSLYDHKI